ncbi:uncharacterized protein LOC124913780 [Impatiens glandulifera]|uniref:uncharacterized protein LOC124913780 n=1 Tax=Impatiens glandulifera TaxID=253017 RepID=UPI001FB10DA4|nr:uncharacterized protein LOC124913780 [Impatiens glandulifera]
MGDFKARCKVAILVILFIWIGLSALYGLLKPISNGCVMTYMYPQYIPISSSETISTSKYGLYLYHEGWKKIDFSEHVRKLRGVPVLFIPGNGGSYKQVRSLASESDRAYQGGPLDSTFYLEASLDDMSSAGFSLPRQYTSMLDWFAVDLEGEHSAMDGQILQEHTEYVVYAIHRILDQYNDSRETQVKQGGSFSRSLPKSVILVGHSMGGFVARAATIHPHLRKSAVETIVTLSSPHQSPPIALQPSLNHYYDNVNRAWQKGYESHVSRSGLHLLDPPLSHVVVVSISGGIHDHQVRTKLESLDGIVPPSHGFMISSSSMRNVWLSMEHQVIMWCNQLVVQVSHTLLSLVDPQTDQPLVDPRKRLTVFTRMLQSGVPQSSNLLKNSLTRPLSKFHVEDGKQLAGTQGHELSPCPSNLHWGDDGLERDLYIRTATVTVLAMDGRRRWMDIRELGSNGSSNFLLVTNLQPCTGIRLHLWPEKGKLGSDLPVSQKVLEVTRKIMQIPSGPTPKQIEPGSQTEQPPPSGVLWLSPEDMHGFRFLTISVAPRPTISGRPPPAASMAVGQFFNPKDGLTELSPWVLFSSSYSAENIILEENHPLAINLSLAIGVGLLPAKLSLRATGCGIKRSVLTVENSGNVENSKLCKLRCFPPVALAWDVTSGLHIFPNFYSKTIMVDSSSALWGSSWGPEKTSVILLVDPHCSYIVSLSVSSTAAAGRFLLLYGTEIVGFSIAIIFFALMRQAHAWEHNLSVPSILSAINSNLRIPLPFTSLVVLPLLVVQIFSFIMYRPCPPFLSFVSISTSCYMFANGAMISLVLISRWIFYVGASIHVWIKLRFQLWERSFSLAFFSWFINLSSSFLSLKAVKIAILNPLLVTAIVAISLVCFVHPALGLFVLLVYHALSCHRTLSSFLTASSSHARAEESSSSNESSLSDDSCCNTPESSKSFSETQLEIFHHQHGLLILHLLALLMFVPSLVAWWQRMGMGQTFPRFVDSALCSAVILHAVCDSKPEFNFFFFPLAKIFPSWELRLSFAYMIGGYYTFISGLSQEPYKAFYPMGIIGLISLVYRIVRRRNGSNSRKHSHRH